jgi:hypothetical protein
MMPKDLYCAIDGNCSCVLSRESYVSEPHETLEGKLRNSTEIHADGPERKTKGFE